MNFIEIKENKKEFIDLLLLADEQESMLDRYLDRGTMYVLEDSGTVIAVCVVTDENGILEIKNLAVRPEYQRMGFGRKFIEFLERKYSGEYSEIKVGTGDSPLTVPFYEKCGFSRTGIIKSFFTDNYDHPIYEGGKMLKDMIYFGKKI